MSNQPDPPKKAAGITIPGQIDIVAGSIVGGDQINNGLDAKETVALLMAELDARGVTCQAIEAGLPRTTVIALAQRLKPGESLAFDQAAREIEVAIEIALDVIARGDRSSNDETFVNAILVRVAAYTRIGALDTGSATLDIALADLDVAHRSQRIALLEEAVQLDILRRDAPSVTRRIEQIVAVDHPDRPSWAPAFKARIKVFFEDGEKRGVNFSLTVAIELERRKVATSRNRNEVGIAQNDLGIALQTLGARESGTTRLDQAVSVYEAALQERTRKRVPLEWATTQNNLGTALQILGERESGTARLEQAVSAYKAALQERTRKRVPLEWAMTQTNLGTALQTLGARENGTARLEQAISVYGAALQECTRQRMPLEWAITQNNLGNTLLTLGERESGTTRLEQSVSTYEAALQERTRERAPLEWAATQNNLGTALAKLGARESGTSRLERAVSIYEAALQERTRERVPLEWAMTQNNLGTALARLGEGESCTTRLEQAISAWDGCLEVVSLFWPESWLKSIRHRRAEALAKIAHHSPA